MKTKMVVFIIIFIVMMNIVGTVYAATISCDINLQTSKTEYKKGEEFKVDVSISNIKSDKGILYLSAILQYDNTCLTLVKMNGVNGWETPIEGTSYNPENGKILISKNELGKNNEIVFSMTFLVKATIDTTTSILLKDIQVANGLETPGTIGLAEKRVTIKQDNTDTDNQNPDDNNNPGDNDQKPDDNNNPGDNDQNPGDNNNPGNNNGKPNNNMVGENNNSVSSGNINDNTIKKGTLPKAGINKNGLIIFIAVVFIVLASYYFIRNKKIIRK